MLSSSEIIDLGNEPDYRKELSKFYWQELFISSYECRQELDRAEQENPGIMERIETWTEADYKVAYEDPAKRREMLFGHK